ncbi:YjbF family lipoprotein [Idiomarina abyssalis]|uniref:YjbF family lipoprotein n=1 Tax=Idiomarina abyssalis TaxID=86102 RepID=UPI002300FC3F|nr:YjbF family lipoprotein [Idiomarina abyssalis]MDA6067170.1 YjbF family lipoprotein [Idiomarina abyssalis]
MLIRYCLLTFFVAMISGCTAVTDEVRETVEHAFSEPENAELSPEKIKTFPYTSLYVQWQGEPRILVVLGFVDKPDDWHFITAEKETLVLRNGRVIRTQDLKRNLLAISKLSEDPLKCIITEPTNCQKNWQREYDYQLDGKSVSRKVASKFYVKEKRVLELPFGKVEVTLVEEKGHYELTGQAFTNRFWVEEDGHVVKSQQQLFADRDPLTLTQVTWIGRDYSNNEAE